MLLGHFLDFDVGDRWRHVDHPPVALHPPYDLGAEVDLIRIGQTLPQSPEPPCLMLAAFRVSSRFSLAAFFEISSNFNDVRVPSFILSHAALRRRICAGHAARDSLMKRMTDQAM